VGTLFGGLTQQRKMSWCLGTNSPNEWVLHCRLVRIPTLCRLHSNAGQWNTEKATCDQHVHGVDSTLKRSLCKLKCYVGLSLVSLQQHVKRVKEVW